MGRLPAIGDVDKAHQWRGSLTTGNGSIAGASQAGDIANQTKLSAVQIDAALGEEQVAQCIVKAIEIKQAGTAEGNAGGVVDLMVIQIPDGGAAVDVDVADQR